MINICKRRKFFTNKYGIDQYKVYSLNKRELCNYIGLWFISEDVFDKEGLLSYRVITTIVGVDKETALHLYNRRFHTLSIWINKNYRNVKENYYYRNEYQMKVHLYSPDDSSYGIWFNGCSIDTLEYFKLKVMEYISYNPRAVSGNGLVEYCKILNPQVKIDYN